MVDNLENLSLFDSFDGLRGFGVVGEDETRTGFYRRHLFRNFESEFLGDVSRFAIDWTYDFGYGVVPQSSHECSVTHSRSDGIDIRSLVPDDECGVGTPVQGVDGVFEFFSFVVGVGGSAVAASAKKSA